MKKNCWVLLLAVMLAAFGSGNAFSKDKHGNNGQGKNKVEDRRGGDRDQAFSDNERALLGRWYQEGRGLPPGLAKRDRLPPGLEKHLIKGGTLPPGLQKKIQPLPIAVERQLRVLPPGYRRGYVGGNIVIMNNKTSLVLDIMHLF